jgi:hypothetical protein
MLYLKRQSELQFIFLDSEKKIPCLLRLGISFFDVVALRNDLRQIYLEIHFNMLFKDKIENQYPRKYCEK